MIVYRSAKEGRVLGCEKMLKEVADFNAKARDKRRAILMVKEG